MIVIREKQMKSLSEVSREEFLKRMEVHVKQHFEPVVAPLTNEQIRQVIERQWKRAEGYGLTSELGVCTWLNIVFTLGEDFEKQAVYPWAVILMKNDEIAESGKIEHLNQNVERELTKALERERR